MQQLALIHYSSDFLYPVSTHSFQSFFTLKLLSELALIITYSIYNLAMNCPTAKLLPYLESTSFADIFF